MLLVATETTYSFGVDGEVIAAECARTLAPGSILLLGVQMLLWSNISADYRLG